MAAGGNADSAIFRGFFSTLVLINAFGNSLVIVIIKRSRSRNAMNFLLLNLAVADLMVGVSMAPVFIFERSFTHPPGMIGHFLCKFVTSGIFTWVGALCSIFSLVLIAVERYFAIMKPLSLRHKLSIAKLRLFVPACWVVSVAFNVPQFTAEYFDETLQTCLQQLPPYYSVLWLVLSAILPGGFMTVLYSRVIYQLWFKTSDRKNVTLQAVRRSRKKVTKTMLTLSAVYILCWFPDGIIYVLANYMPSQFPYRGAAHIASIFLAVLNSSVNPIVYAFQFKEFRRELGKLMRCGAVRRCVEIRRVPSPNSAKYDVQRQTTAFPDLAGKCGDGSTGCCTSSTFVDQGCSLPKPVGYAVDGDFLPTHSPTHGNSVET